ncbi:MAG: DsbA family protein [Candidatus Diapherotrites archaeon]|nr:DsbA family protein [Candidatus Diapherotrites archaeon]
MVIAMVETEDNSKALTEEKKEKKPKNRSAQIVESNEESKGKISLDTPVFAMFLVLALVVGALISAAIFYFYFKPTNNQPNNSTCTLPMDSKNCIAAIKPEEAGEKVRAFLEESFLKSYGYKLIVNKVTAYNECLYDLNASIVTEDGNMPAGLLLVTKDGKKVIIASAVYDTNAPIKPTPVPSPTPFQAKIKSDRPDVLMFVMTFCPYGHVAEKGLKPVAELFGDKINIEPHYVIYSGEYGYTYPDDCIDKEKKYCSMHGVSELNEGVRQLCIFKYQKDKFWDYIAKIYEGKCTLKNIDSCWKSQAEAAGIDTQKIEKCFEEEAISLLEKEVELNKKYNVMGSPTIIINETEYRGGRAPENYKAAICTAFNTPPTECSKTLSSQGGTASGQC